MSGRRAETTRDLAAAAASVSIGANRLYDLRFVLNVVLDPRARGTGVRPWHTLRRVDDLGDLLAPTVTMVQHLPVGR